MWRKVEVWGANVSVGDDNLERWESASDVMVWQRGSSDEELGEGVKCTSFLRMRSGDGLATEVEDVYVDEG